MSTGIEWTEETWNPIVGCSRVSEGCRHCYAERMASRQVAMGTPQYAGTSKNGRWTGKLNLVEEALEKPLRWKKPRKVFVNSMSDLFHEAVPDEWIIRVVAVMQRCPQHTFQILTKRAERMLDFCSRLRWNEGPIGSHYLADDREDRSGWRPFGGGGCTPLSNVGFGVSVEDQASAAARLGFLLRCPAAWRFVSLEPMLGPVDFSCVPRPAGWEKIDDLSEGIDPLRYRDSAHPGRRGLDWVICGGESGPGARPMHVEWPRSVRDQCVAAAVPFFFKQWGEWMPLDAWQEQCSYDGDGPTFEWMPDSRLSWVSARDLHDARADTTMVRMVRVGKKAAGAVLDGREWREFPESWPQEAQKTQKI